ncbi:hypothetical protein ACIQ34_09605 [Ureibacillus sp. NPDC094379]
MEKSEHLFEERPLEEINKCFSIPFMLITNVKKPFIALGRTKEGYYFSSPYFILKNIALNDSFIELTILLPVGMDGCVVDYPESFYSLQTTKNSIFVSTKPFSEIQTCSSKFVDRELID